MSVDPPTPDRRRGYRRAFERYPDLEAKVGEFDRWLKAVEEWLVWIEHNIPENAHISRVEALEDFHITTLGLEILERIGVDIYPDGREVRRTEYDLKKLLRAVVALPSVARLTGKRLSRKHEDIHDVFREVVDDTLNGRLPLDEIPLGPGHEEATA